MVTTYALFDADAFSKSPELDRARRELYKARDIPSLLTEITGSLERLSLDVAHPGQHTIADLLSQAHAALARPVLDEGRAISTLVPIRSAIDEVVAALGRRCPGQQRMKGWPKKVLFVGGQCARPGVTSIAIESLSVTAGELHDHLSDAKAAALSREQMVDLFHRSLMFLNTMLSGLDATRLRSA